LYFRTLVEVRWFQALAADSAIPECPALSASANAALDAILDTFDEDAAEKIKSIEAETNHDVKAVEYYLKTQFEQHDALSAHSEFLHFAEL